MKMEELCCAICRSLLYQPVSLASCQHVFCKLCIKQCKESVCPTCRAPFSVAFQIDSHNRLLESIIQKQFPDEYKKRETEFVESIQQQTHIDANQLRNRIASRESELTDADIESMLMHTSENIHPTPMPNVISAVKTLCMYSVFVIVCCCISIGLAISAVLTASSIQPWIFHLCLCMIWACVLIASLPIAANTSKAFVFGIQISFHPHT